MRRLPAVVVAVALAAAGAGCSKRAAGPSGPSVATAPASSAPAPTTTASTVRPSGPTSAASTAPGTAGVLRVGDVPAAVSAVQQTLGGPQQYTEINVISSGVNLFVAAPGGQERAYFYGDGMLQPPGEPTAAQTTPFGLDGVDLGAPARLVPDVQQRFPGATVETVALVRTSDLGVVWGLRTRSAKGGVLNVFYSPDGRLVSVSPA